MGSRPERLGESEVLCSQYSTRRAMVKRLGPKMRVFCWSLSRRPLLLEGALDVIDPQSLARGREEHADHVEAEIAPRNRALTGEPDARDAADLGALGRPNRLERRRRAGRGAAGPGDERLHLAEDERAPAGAIRSISPSRVRKLRSTSV